MTALPSLTNALADAGSALNGLLSKLGGSGAASGGDAFDQAFAGMLSQQDEPANASSNASQAVTASPAPQMSSLSSLTGDSTAAPLQQIQQLQALATSLRHTLNQIQHPAPGTAQTATGPASSHGFGATAPGSTANTITTPTATGFHAATDTTTTAAAAATDASASATPTATGTTSDPTTTDQSIAALLAQLLATVQQVIAQLKKNDAAGADATATVASGTTTGTQATASMTASTASANSLTTALLNTATAAAQTTGTDDTSGGTDDLADLVQLMEKTAQRLIKAADSLIAPPATGTAAASVTTGAMIPLTAGMAANRMASLSDEITTVLQGFKKAATPASTGTATSTSSAATTAAAQVATPPAPSPAAKVEASEKQAQLTPVATGQATAPTTDASPANITAAFASGLTPNGAQTGNGDTATDDNANNSATGAIQDTRATAMPEAVARANSFTGQLAAVKSLTPSTVTASQVVDQVVLQISRGVKNGNDQMSLQLSPGDLGKITVKLDFGSDGKVQGTVTADNPKTLDMLQKDSRSLERALNDAGLRADSGSLSFNLGQQQNQQNAQSGAQNASSSGSNGTLSASQDDDGDASGTVSESYYVTPRGVNIRV